VKNQLCPKIKLILFLFEDGRSGMFWGAFGLNGIGELISVTPHSTSKDYQIVV